MKRPASNAVTALALFIFCLSFIGAASPSKAAPTLTDFTAVDALIEEQMQHYRVPGVALAIVEGDQVAYLKGYGTAGAGRPVTPQTPFMIGSTGKSITAVAIMQLVEAGQVELDAPVQRYLPEFTLADSEAAQEITVRMLLGHISGLPEAAGIIFQASRDVSPTALENRVRALASVKLARTPGSAYEYSNANYDTLGLIV